MRGRDDFYGHAALGTFIALERPVIRMNKFIVLTLLTFLTAACGGGGGGSPGPTIDEANFHNDGATHVAGVTYEDEGYVRFDLGRNGTTNNTLNLCPAGGRVITNGQTMTMKEARTIFEAYVKNYVIMKQVIAHEVVYDERTGRVLEGELGLAHNGFTLGGYDKRTGGDAGRNAFHRRDGRFDREDSDWRRSTRDSDSDE